MSCVTRLRRALWAWPFVNAIVVMRLIASRMTDDGVGVGSDDGLSWFPLPSTRCGDAGATRCPLGCSGRGRCTESGVCACHPAWSGEGCEVPRCPRDCSGAGTCLPTGVCLCDRGVVGEDCSIDRFNISLPDMLERVGSPFSSNAKFAENLDVVMSYKFVHRYGFMLCKTPVCKSSWDYALTTIFPSLARDDVRFNFNDCAVVASAKSIVPKGAAEQGHSSLVPARPHVGKHRQTTSGEEIDRHQMILRLDNAPTKGFEEWVGRRTTHRLVTAEYAKHVHGLLGSVIQTSNSTRMLVNSNGWWDSGMTPADRLVYLMAVKMTPMGKGEWRSYDKASLTPFRDVFPGPKKFVLSPVFMSRAHASWERLKAAMRDLGLGCYKRKPAGTYVPSVVLAALYSMQMCKRVNVYGVGLEEDANLAAGERQAVYHERDTDCCYYHEAIPNKHTPEPPTCNHLAKRVALHLLAMNNRVTLVN